MADNEMKNEDTQPEATVANTNQTAPSSSEGAKASGKVGTKDDTDLGLEPNLTAALAYVFPVIVGIIVLLTEKTNKFTRFHAVQSLIFSVAMIAVMFVFIFLSFVPIVQFFTGCVMMFGWIAVFVYALFVAYKAYQGEWYKIPYIGDFAEKQI